MSPSPDRPEPPTNPARSGGVIRSVRRRRTVAVLGGLMVLLFVLVELLLFRSYAQTERTTRDFKTTTDAITAVANALRETALLGQAVARLSLRRLLDPGDGAAGTAGAPARRRPGHHSSPRRRGPARRDQARPQNLRPRVRQGLRDGRAGAGPGAAARRSGASWRRSSAGSRTTSTIRSTRCMTPWRERWTSGRPVSGWSWG